MNKSCKKIRDWVEETPFIDTHEHLLEESQRVSARLDPRLFVCNDWAYLFQDYVAEDFIASGMPTSELQQFLGSTATDNEKFRLVERYWKRVRHTGYGQALRYTFQELYGQGDLTRETYSRIAERYHDLVRPGFYSRVFKAANVEICHVNSMQRTFMKTEQPSLLKQDLSILGLCRCSAADFARVEAETDRRPASLEGWLDTIDSYFATCGPQAVAVKCQIAYSRALDFEPVTKTRAARLFVNQADRSGRFHALGPEDLKALQDYLFRYCVAKAGDYGLPVKLHTGILASNNVMHLSRVRDNARDLCRLLQDFPEVQFVLMHIGYPYEREFIALAKHYSNVSLDMCWSWIINPIASRHFLKEFLVTVPSHKVFTFGGDYVCAEPIVGHARIARIGISNAISELVADGWIVLEEARDLIEQIMRGNALDLFPTRTQSADGGHQVG
ncbi:amidohydrolase [Mesorhizobium sp. M1409]|uniref:amidohydrolase family protein n=1 Tax=unclassified Mesorhizobium TaxID=325217 RepID=UPI00333B3976